MAQRDNTLNEEDISAQLEKMASEMVREGRFGEAVDLYLKLIARHPGDDSFLLSLAWVYHDNGRIEEAITAFETLLEKELSRKVFTGFAFDELARIFKRQGRYDRLLHLCERAVAAQPGDYALLGDLGDACLKSGQAERAAAVYREMVAMEPEDAVAFCNLGNALVALEDFSGAEASYAQAAAIEPEKKGAYYGRLAEAYRRANRGKEAETAILCSIREDIREPAYRLILGDLLIAGGKTEDGCKAYEEAVSLRPTSAGAYYHRLGNTFARETHYEQAVAAFRKAIAVEPNNPLYYVKLAEALLALGRGDEARQALDQTTSA